MIELCENYSYLGQFSSDTNTDRMLTLYKYICDFFSSHWSHK